MNEFYSAISVEMPGHPSSPTITFDRAFQEEECDDPDVTLVIALQPVEQTDSTVTDDGERVCSS